MALEYGLKMEMDAVHQWATIHDDAMEGLRAFTEKRKPRFRGGAQ